MNSTEQVMIKLGDIMRFLLSVAMAGLTAAAVVVSAAAGSYAKDANQPSAAAATAAAAVGAAWDTKIEATSSSSVAGTAFDEQQMALIQKIDAYFNQLDNLKGRFVQTDANNKRLKGRFYLKRPGRFRFDYSRPSRLVIISDGKYMAIQDATIGTDDRIALARTPIRLLLRKNVNILRDARILQLQETEDLAIIALRDKSSSASGEIKLFLTKNPQFALKEWITTDAQNLKTRVEVSQLDTTKNLSKKLFKYEWITKPKF